MWIVLDSIRKGKTISFTSALLLELMQLGTHDVQALLRAADVEDLMDVDEPDADVKAMAPMSDDVGLHSVYIRWIWLTRLMIDAHHADYGIARASQGLCDIRLAVFDQPVSGDRSCVTHHDFGAESASPTQHIELRGG